MFFFSSKIRRLQKRNNVKISADSGVAQGGDEGLDVGHDVLTNLLLK
jgi:hypothetical protein